jgi:hypothetical protein
MTSDDIRYICGVTDECGVESVVPDPQMVFLALLPLGLLGDLSC